MSEKVSRPNNIFTGKKNGDKGKNTNCIKIDRVGTANTDCLICFNRRVFDIIGIDSEDRGKQPQENMV